MKKVALILIYIISFFAYHSLFCQNNLIECNSKINAVKAVTFEASFSTSIAADASSEWLRTPVASTSFKSKKGCAIVKFSAITKPSDNHSVFQIRIDGTPINGHVTGYLEGVEEKIISIADETDKQGPHRAISYHFFTEVPKGKHDLELFFGGCCSPENPKGSNSELLNPTLVISYCK